MGQGVPDAQDASVSFPRHLFAPHSLLLGSGLCLAAVGLAFYISHAVHAADLRERTIFLLHAAQIELNEELRQTRLWTEHAADCLTETTSVSPLALAEACSLLWPDGLLSVYGGRGGIPGQTIAGSGKDAAPSGGEADLLRRAETGAAAAFLIIDNQIRLGAAVRTAAAPARTLLVSRPLSADILARMKSRLGADLAVLIPDASGKFRQAAALAGIDISPETLPEYPSGRAESVFADISLAGRLRPAGIAPLGGEEGAQTAFLLVAPEQESPADLLAPFPLAAAALGAFCAFLLLSYAQYRQGLRAGKNLAANLKDFILHGTVSPGTSLPASLFAALREIRADIAAARALAGKAIEERDETRRKLEEKGNAPPQQDDGFFRTFFEDAQTGFFLIRADGDFLRVNQAFARMLDYESPAHVLSEKTCLSDFFLNREEAGSFLATLQELPGRPLAATLRRRDGLIGNFTSLSLRPVLEGADGLPTIAGALTDRSLEEQNTRLRQECAHMNRHNRHLALFFAAACRQAQAHLFPHILDNALAPNPKAAPDREANGAAESGLAYPDAGRERNRRAGRPENEASFQEQKHIIRAHQSVFADICRISLAEAENAALSSVPMDLMQILEEVFLQVLPVLHEQGTTLFCEVDRNIDPQVHGSDLILRHTLVRALLSVAGPMRGGRAFLGLTTVPGASLQDSSGRIQFTLAWDSGPLPDADRTGAPVAEISRPGFRENASTGFSPDEEQDVLRFLVDKIQGELLPVSLGAGTRSIRFIVRFGLEAMPPLSSLAESLPAPEASPFQGAEPGGLPPATASVTLPPPETAGIPNPEKDLFPQTGGDPPPLASLAGLPDLLTPDSPLPLEVPLPSHAAGDAEGSLNILIPDEQAAGAVDSREEALDLLLINANLNDRLLFSSCLRGTRHRVTEAHDGLQGVEAFQNQDFDVIFMDMEMPLMDGYQATRVIRALEADVGRRLTPIVAFTAQILPDFKYQCLLAGCTDFLGKPFNQTTLLAMLHNFTREKHARHPLEGAVS